MIKGLRFIVFVFALQFAIQGSMAQASDDNDIKVPGNSDIYKETGSTTDRLIWLLAVDGQKAVEHQDPNLMFELMQKAFGTMHISRDDENRRKFKNAYDLLSSEQIPEPQKDLAQRALRNLIVLQSFWEKTSPAQRRGMLTTYRMTYGTIWENTKHKIYELPEETIVFTVAIIADRMITCLRPQGLFTWETTIQDPTCLYELGEMLATPSYYAGFSAFIVASGVTNVALMKSVKLFSDRGWTKLKPQQLQFAFSNISLAMGFLADHFVRTIVDNENLHKCAGAVVAQKSSVKVKDLKHYELGRDSEGKMNYSFWAHFQDIHCTKFRNELGSAQFLGEHTLSPMVSLLTSAGLMTLGGQAGASIARLFGFVRPALTMTGVGGFTMKLGRLLIFFKINHLVEPHIRRMFYSLIVAPRVDSHRSDILASLQKAKAVIDAKPAKNIVDEELPEEAPEKTAKVELDEQKAIELKDRLTKFSVPEIQSEETCSTHYSGNSERPELELCSKIPLLPSLASFHDYAKSWRSHRILGDYLMHMGRWKKKYDTYFMNYHATMEHMRTLSRSQEIRFTGNSKAYQKAIGELKQRGMKTAETLAKESNETAEEVWQRNQKKYADFIKLDVSNENERQKAAELLTGLGKEMSIFNNIKAIDDLTFQLEAMKENLPYSGIAEEIVKNLGVFKGKIKLLFNHPEFAYYTIYPKNFAGTATGENLAKAGVPDEFITNPQDPKFVSWFLDQNDDNLVAIGLMMAERILPAAKLPNANDPTFSEQSPEDLKAEILETLADFGPQFKYENLYGLVYKNYSNKVQQPTEQWNKFAYRYTTKNLSSYTVSQILCGPLSEGWGIFGFKVDEGFPAFFEHPTISDTNHCESKIFDVTDGRKEDMLPSLERSIFATPWGIYAGVYNAYINQPKSKFRFLDEAEAADWWNKEIRQNALSYLINLERDFTKMNAQDLAPLVTERAQSMALLGLSDWPKFASNDSCKAYKFSEDISCHSKVNTALAFELNVYFQVLKKLLRNEPAVIGNYTEKYQEFAGCFVDLMNSVTSKNYKEQKIKCEASLNKLKDILIYEGETRGQLEQIKRAPEESLTPAQVRKKVIDTTFVFIDELMAEVSNFAHIYAGDYSFKLEEKFGGEIK